MKAKDSYFIEWKTMGHIPREISRYIYFFIKDENGKVFDTFVKYKVSPIPSGGLEVSLPLSFSCKERWVINTIEKFVEEFYSFEYSGNLHSVDDTNDSDDKKEIDYQTITLETENVKEEIDDPEQTDSEIDKNLDIPIVIDDE